MPIGDSKILQAVTSFLDRQKLEYTTSEQQYCDKLTVRSGTHLAYVSVYNTGRIVIGGKHSTLKALLEEMKSAIEAGESAPGQALPFEIDRFPETILERVPECDPVIVSFINEGIRCVRADTLVAATFMLGAASERAINLLIYAFADAMIDQRNRDRFLARVNNRTISKKYDEFSASYNSCKTKPVDPVLGQDLDAIIGSMFQFCRITRNQVGHPQIVPDLDRGVILANLGHFVTYIERIYGLMRYFKDNAVVL